MLNKSPEHQIVIVLSDIEYLKYTQRPIKYQTYTSHVIRYYWQEAGVKYFCHFASEFGSILEKSNK